jgi:uncharacterized repeat protein (TIGR04076 family)
MQYKCKVTVIDKKCFTDFQQKYLADVNSGPCPFYNVGDEFIFERYGDEDTFWREGNGTQCAEAWDCISRYIYTALQGGSIMRNWTNDERMMIACCNDGTRPVIFKIERLDYKVVKIDGMNCEKCASKIKHALENIEGVDDVNIRTDKKWAEVFVRRETAPDDSILKEEVEKLGEYRVTGID